MYNNKAPSILNKIINLRNKLFPKKSLFGEEYYLKKIKKMIPEHELYYIPTVEKQIRNIMDKKGLQTVWSYYLLLKFSRKERDYLRRNLTKSGSNLFRGEEWDILEEKCLSAFTGRERVRCWSAGCSSGEEVYSLILALMDYVPPASIEVLATDYNEDMLEKCRNPMYGQSHFAEVPEKYRKYQIIEGNFFTFSDEIKGRVTPQKLNLLLDDYPSGFDIILCRNVIKFFNDENKRIVQQKLIDSLVPGGFLFVAINTKGINQETLPDPEAFGVEPIGRSIYRKL